MIRLILKNTAILCITLLVCSSAYAGGLSTEFVSVILKDIEPGETYSVKELTGKTLIVKNTTDSVAVDLQIEPERPQSYHIVKGYKTIPDISWVKIEKDYFEGVMPKSSAETDILITIPKEEQYYGKKYQVYIFSHTSGKSTFSLGLMSRILIHTKDKPKKRSFMNSIFNPKKK